MISSIEDHLSSLYRLRRFGIQLELSTISRLMRGLGHPQTSYRCVHVAGTNGKGSTSSFIASVLSEAGFKVGLYTSPHLVRFNERIQINGIPIADADLLEAAEAVRSVYAQSDPPTFFEAATAMAFHYFAARAVDWAVVETGMGGRYDATNIIQPEVSVITNIGIEHTEFLGNTVAEIAGEKAGIIKSGANVVTGAQQHEALSVIEKVAREKAVSLYRFGKEISILRDQSQASSLISYIGPARKWSGVSVGLLGNHQFTNAALALGALELLLDKGVMIPDAAVYSGIKQTHWPGRLEIVSKEPTVIMDGAHNPAAVQLLKEFLDSDALPRKRLFWVLGILGDKDWKFMLSTLLSPEDRVFLARPDQERAADPNRMSAYAKSLCDHVDVILNLPAAIDKAMQEACPQDLICITGSLYTVGEAKAYFEGSGKVDGSERHHCG